MTHEHVTVLGCGNVGGSLIFSLLGQRNHPIVLNIMDPGPWQHGRILDLLHTAPLGPHHVVVNSREHFLSADYIFHTAGVQNKAGSSRLEISSDNSLLTDLIFHDATFEKEPFVIAITNPVDVIAYRTWLASGIPAEKIVGTGTFLERMRLAHYLSETLRVPSSQIDAWVLGEHGDSQVPIFSQTYVNGVRVEDLISDAESFALAAHRTKTAAQEIRKTQDATHYGVARCAEAIFHQLHSPRVELLPLSVRPSEHYRKLLHVGDIFLSLPVKVSNAGIVIDDEFELSTPEWTALRVSAHFLESHIKTCPPLPISVLTAAAAIVL